MIQHAFEWLSPQVTQHVALALVHSLWQGTLAAFVLAALLRLLHDRESDNDEAARTSAGTRSNARYAIACLGLLAIAALPVVNLLVMETAADNLAATTLEQEARSLDSPDASQQANTEAARAEIAAQPTVMSEATVVNSESGPAGPSIAVGPGRTANREDAVGALLGPSIRQGFLQSFFWIWLGGVTLLSAWHMAGWALSQRLRRGRSTPSDDILALVARIARRLGIRQTVAVRQTLGATTPMVLGWLKPALILPVSLLTRLAPQELEAVVAHELAHVRRQDYLVNLIQTLVETMLFYHPAVWWLSHRIRVEREFCADDVAMRICDGREVYARSLVAVAEVALGATSHAMAATGGSLLHRVRRILRVVEQPTPLPPMVKCSAFVGVTAAICLGTALIAGAQGQRDRAPDAQDDEPIADAPDQPGEQQPEAAARTVPERERFRIEPATGSREWRTMVSRAAAMPQIRSGQGRMTLMRVVLEGGAADATVQLAGTKLLVPGQRSGGGRFLQVQNGDFALVEHINSLQRRENKDPVEIGGFAHYRSTIWVDVGSRGQVAVLGDVVLSPVPTEQMGRMLATIEPDAMGINVRRCRVGPLVVGGPYGESLPFQRNRTADTGPIAPGTYEILLPDFDMKKSRWTVEVRPGHVTELQFVARSQQEIEKADENYRREEQRQHDKAVDREPEDATEGVESTSPSLQARDPYSDVLRFLTITPAELPPGCALSELKTAPLVPAGILRDRQRIAHVAAFFGITSRKQLDDVQAAVSVVYEEAGPRDGLEIGVYALCLSDEKAAADLVERLPALGDVRNAIRGYISNGNLALCVWRDEGVSDGAYAKVLEYFRTTKYDESAAEKDAEQAGGRERVGELFGRPVYRDEIRKDFEVPFELHRIFLEPVRAQYQKEHRTETELTEEEVQGALRYREQEENAKGPDGAEAWQKVVEEEESGARKRLNQIDARLARSDLSTEDREQLKADRAETELVLAQPGRLSATFLFSRMKFHRHLYDTYGGGRILLQQLGPEAIDAEYRWIREREEKGDFRIADEKLRSEFYKYWTDQPGPSSGGKAAGVGIDAFRVPLVFGDN